MSIFKDSKEKQDERFEREKKEFLADMSYKIRNPLNSIYGMSEIVKRNVIENANKEQILMYMQILSDAAEELKSVIDEGFRDYEQGQMQVVDDEDVTEDDYTILYNLRVLVVEDSSANQMVVKELMESKGAKVSVCQNGQEAVDMFTKSIAGTYDVIMMDIKMPVMDGYEATDRIRRSGHPQAKTIPIIAMTAEALASDIEASIKSGMNAHLTKPFGISKIVAAIKLTK